MKKPLPTQYHQTAQWMYRYLHGRNPDPITASAWAKKLHLISNIETEKEWRDLFLAQSVFVYAMLDEKWKRKIDNPAKLDCHFREIATDAISFCGEELLAQVAALVYVYGGEYVCMNISFRFYIPLLKRHFNLSGGRSPRSVGIIQKKISELEIGGDKTEWFPAFYANALSKELLPKVFEPVPERMREKFSALTT